MTMDALMDMVKPKGEQKMWRMRYKIGNHSAESSYVKASSMARARAVGEAWCNIESSKLMKTVKFINVEDPILADETLIG